MKATDISCHSLVSLPIQNLTFSLLKAHKEAKLSNCFSCCSQPCRFFSLIYSFWVLPKGLSQGALISITFPPAPFLSLSLLILLQFSVPHWNLNLIWFCWIQINDYNCHLEEILATCTWAVSGHFWYGASAEEAEGTSSRAEFEYSFI